jgi:hypothetical protein
MADPLSPQPVAKSTALSLLWQLYWSLHALLLERVKPVGEEPRREGEGGSASTATRSFKAGATDVCRAVTAAARIGSSASHNEPIVRCCFDIHAQSTKAQ